MPAIRQSLLRITSRPPVPPLRRLADLLTIARALLGLPLLLALGSGQQDVAWGLLLLGGLSDAADGALARRAGGGSVWGARLDPLTDKILISAPLIWLAARGLLPIWAVWLLLARELLISGWRARAAAVPPPWRGRRKRSCSSWLCCCCSGPPTGPSGCRPARRAASGCRC